MSTALVSNKCRPQRQQQMHTTRTAANQWCDHHGVTPLPPYPTILSHPEGVGRRQSSLTLANICSGAPKMHDKPALRLTVHCKEMLAAYRLLLLC